LDEKRVRLALTAQNRYLVSLKDLFRQELSQDDSEEKNTRDQESPTSGSSSKSNPSSNAVEQYDRQQLIKRGTRYLDELLKQFRVSIPPDLQSLQMENLKAGGNSKSVMKLLNPYLAPISALPLARNVRKEMLEILKRFSEKDPHASYAECLLFRKRATMLLSAIRAGNEGQGEVIESLLNEAMHAISRSVQKIKKIPHEERPMMIREYAVVGQLLFHSLSRIQKMLSPEQFSHFEKASEMLPEIYQEKGVPELLDKMKKIIREIRGDQTPKEEKTEEFIEEKEAPKKESDSKKQEIQHDDNPRRRNIFEKELPSEEELYSKKKQDKPKENIFHKPV
jgi:Sec-independent protein translocase protein TatA